MEYTDRAVAYIIEQLKDDEKYYGDFGKEFLSNSSIKTLLNNPLAYLEPVTKTKEMLIGTYIHNDLQMVKPEDNLQASPETSRNSKAYKEARDASGEELLLLQSELDEIKPILERTKANSMFMELLQGNVKEGEIEQPMIKKLFGVWFKAKADRINNACNIVIDIKTTSDITKFKSSFFTYGYDTQAYIYQQLFNKEVVFLVIDKKTGQLGHYSVSPHILAQAEEKVKRAIQIRDMYYISKTEDLDQFVIIEEI
tara:strand:- start:11147 stop:11908 length:762 start_codon:yes stop_codon:yes gene_type:complete